MGLPSVAIVILNWNGKNFLQQFLPSVLKTTYANHKIIVADNASTDDSVFFLQEDYPQVQLIFLQENFGYAKGYNQALKQVEADYFVLLNSDVEVTPTWVEPVIELLESDKAAACCQPKILSYHQKQNFEYAGAAGGWIDAYGYPFARGRIFDVCEADEGQYNVNQKIFWASGAALFIRRQVFEQLNGLDETFFAHMEEIDLCWRAQLAGHIIYCCPQSVVYHVGGGTLPQGNSRKTFLNYRNNQIMLAKNLPLHQALYKIPWRMALDQISGLRILLTGQAGYFFAVVKAHLSFLSWLFTHNLNWKPVRKKKITSLNGVYKGNIVFAYFIKKKNKFSQVILSGKE